MNKKRRTVLQIVADNLERLRMPLNNQEAKELLQDSIDKVQRCADEEQDAYDNLPESLQFSTLGENISDNISDLEDAVGDFECILATYEEAEGPVMFDIIQADYIAGLNNLANAIDRR